MATISLNKAYNRAEREIVTILHQYGAMHRYDLHRIIQMRNKAIPFSVADVLAAETVLIARKVIGIAPCPLTGCDILFVCVRTSPILDKIPKVSA